MFTCSQKRLILKLYQYLLSTKLIILLIFLQANTLNVKIHQKGNFQEGIDKYELELLTTVRHFEQLEEYQAPSIAKS